MFKSLLILNSFIDSIKHKHKTILMEDSQLYYKNMQRQKKKLCLQTKEEIFCIKMLLEKLANYIPG